MKKKLFTLLILTTLFCLQILHATPENNPPICVIHDYVESTTASRPSWRETSFTINKNQASTLPLSPGGTSITYTCTKCGASYPGDSTSNTSFAIIECKDWNGNSMQNIYTIQGLSITFNTGGVFYLRLSGNYSEVLELTVVGDDDDDGLNSHDEILIYNTDPYDSDSDDDGLNDGDEVSLYNTDPNDSDSDADGLSDYAEVFVYETNPNNPDTDGDTIRDDVEIAHGMNPNTVAIQENGFLYEQRIIEDAEDGVTTGWVEYTSTNATVSNVADPVDANNKVIQFQGTGTSSGFEFDLSPVEIAMRNISWRMKFSETYYIYVKLDTSEGDRYIAYNPSVQNVNSNTVSIPLGTNTFNGVWRIFIRNLVDDLKSGFPNATINSVTQIRVSGSGMVDDIKMMAYVDSDNDGIPDLVEYANGLDKSSAADAGTDLDNDGLTNLEEFCNGSNMNSSDSDSDGINDITEIATYGSNVNSNDSDGDRLTDYWELTNFGNQTQTLNSDHDSDGFSNFEEDHLILGFSVTQEVDNNIDLTVYEYKK